VRKEAAQLQRRLAGLATGVEVLPVICLAGDPFAEERLETDGLIICNGHSLCAVLLSRIGDDSQVSAAPVIRRLLGTMEDGAD
jgi:hypothetical protein